MPAQQGLATPLISAIARHLNADGQVLLFLNRRGYAPALFCSACGWIAQCDRCDARMTVHMASARMRCHHCGRDQATPENCLSCNEKLVLVGQGTERTEETLARLFPGVPIGRIDRDTTQKRGAMDKLLADMHSGHTRLLVGTQMLTKGHHFPGVTLVAVLNADQGLFGSDFRSNERFAQTLVQVSGRAGRAEKKGEVLIQTSYPEHPLLKQLIENGYSGFAKAALKEREEAHVAAIFPAGTAARRSCQPGTAAAVSCRSGCRSHPAAGRQRGDPGTHSGPRARADGAAGRPIPGAAPAAITAQGEPAPSSRTAGYRCWRASNTARRVRWSLDVDPVELF